MKKISIKKEIDFNLQQEYLYNIRAIDFIAKEIKKYIKKTKCHVMLYGEMGSGKTTLVKSIIKAILEKDILITSPTYTYLNQYKKENLNILHFDLYRLKNVIEFEQLGFFEYLNSSENICLIEWPEIIDKSLENYNVIKIYIKYIDEKKRIIQFKA